MITDKGLSSVHLETQVGKKNDTAVESNSNFVAILGLLSIAMVHSALCQSVSLDDNPGRVATLNII